MPPSIVPIVSALGAELRRLRKDEKKITQRAVAVAIESDPSSISEWETGKRRITLDVLERLAPVLGVTVPYLLKFGEAYDPNGPRVTKRQREANTTIPLDGTAEAGSIPAHVTTTEGGFLGMLLDDETALVGNYRLAKRINPAEAAALLAAAADIATGRRSLLPKSPRHSGGKA